MQKVIYLDCGIEKEIGVTTAVIIKNRLRDELPAMVQKKINEQHWNAEVYFALQRRQVTPLAQLVWQYFHSSDPKRTRFLFAKCLTKTNRTLKWNQRNTFFSFFSAALEWVVFTWRHSRHVGAQNEREKCLSIIMQNTSHNLLLFCAPARPSYHVIENHLYLLHWDLLSKTH